jgi:hypothetical protein
MASRTGMGRAEVAVQVNTKKPVRRPQTFDIGTDMEDAIDEQEGKRNLEKRVEKVQMFLWFQWL